MEKKKDFTISLVVPVYNEEESIQTFIDTIDKELEPLRDKLQIVFVNDGSRDKTRQVIEEVISKDPRVTLINLARNFGKEAAMYAGLKNAKGDFVCVMDCDLQDPPEMIESMLARLAQDNCDCVATRRVTRKGEPKIRSFFARFFYRLINRMTDVEIVDGARDFRVMTHEVADAILSLSERQRFSKGIFSWVGFRTEWIEYENVERAAGETKWSFWKLFKYAVEGIVSFTTVPLRLATFSGFFVSAASFVYIIYYVTRTLIWGIPVPGYPSLLAFILFLGGITLLALGILGEYLARTYMEVKRRPLYIIRKKK